MRLLLGGFFITCYAVRMNPSHRTSEDQKNFDWITACERRGVLQYALTLHDNFPIQIQRFQTLNEYLTGGKIPETASVQLAFLATF
jgi:hypothetical protein